MEWWAAALGAAVAGVSFSLERKRTCRYVPEVAGVLNGAALAAISLDPVAASAAVGLLLGMLLAGAAKGRGDYLALATYFLIFVMLNEYAYIIPTTIVVAGAFADWELARRQGILGKRVLTHVAAAITVPLVGWTPLLVTLIFDGAYRTTNLIGRGS